MYLFSKEIPDERNPGYIVYNTVSKHYRYTTVIFGTNPKLIVSAEDVIRDGLECVLFDKLL